MHRTALQVQDARALVIHDFRPWVRGETFGAGRRTSEAPRVAVALVVERDAVLLAARNLHNLLPFDRTLDHNRVGLLREEDFRRGDVLSSLCT